VRRIGAPAGALVVAPDWAEVVGPVWPPPAAVAGLSAAAAIAFAAPDVGAELLAPTGAGALPVPAAGP
jgi:hypothetical protein